MAAKGKPAAPEEPFEVRNEGGQTKILIYPRGRGGYVFRYYLGGKSRTVERVDRAEAIKEALRIAAGIDAGSAHAGKLTASDAESYVHAVSQLGDGAPPLHAVVAEWIALRKAIGQTPMSEVIALWKRASRRRGETGSTVAATVQALSDLYLAELRTRASHSGSRRYLLGFAADLPRFCERFASRSIAELSVGELETWLREQGVGPRRQDNLRGELVTFFRWARERGHLDEDRKTEPEKIAKVYKATKDIEYWRPAELRQILAAVDPKWLPCLVLAAFAGLRISEIGRLDWSAFDWATKRVHVRKTVALKTGLARRVPLSSNLIAWLQRHQRESGRSTGRLYDYANPSGEWVKETKRIERQIREGTPGSPGVPAVRPVPGFRWRNNNLRHAYGSYQMALVDNYGQVAAWMGNTEAVVKSNYDGVASPAEAAEWYAIAPDGEGKIISLGATA